MQLSWGMPPWMPQCFSERNGAMDSNELIVTPPVSDVNTLGRPRPVAVGVKTGGMAESNRLGACTPFTAGYPPPCWYGP